MATSELSDNWQAYRTAFDAFEEACHPLERHQEPSATEVNDADHALSDVATCAERIADYGLALLQAATGEDRERIATFLLATAATDIAIACEALQLPPDRPDPDPEIRTHMSEGWEVESARSLEVSSDEKATVS
jgi:hypothetical protein